MRFCCVCGKPQIANSQVRFHVFPTGKGKEIYLESWKKFINKPSSWEHKKALVCSDHFENDDYEVTSKGLRLKFFAIPHIRTNLELDNNSSGIFSFI